MGFFESFSAPFMMSVALWPLVSFIVTVPVLAMLYHRDNRLGFGAALSAYATVLYLIGLLCFTLYPMPDDPAAYCATHHLHPQLNPLQFIGDIRADGLTAILQIVMNVVFFVPLGFIMKRVFRWKFAVALPVGFLASLLVETMQLTGVMGVFPCSYRLFDVDDLIWNTSGAVIGYGCAMLFDRVICRGFAYHPDGTPGALADKTVRVIMLTGGSRQWYESDGIGESLDNQICRQTFAKYCGVKDAELVYVDNLSMGDDSSDKRKAAAAQLEGIRQLGASLA